MEISKIGIDSIDNEWDGNKEGIGKGAEAM